MTDIARLATGQLATVIEMPVPKVPSGRAKVAVIVWVPSGSVRASADPIAATVRIQEGINPAARCGT